ncbi:MAG: hypothetical protein WB392_10305 [Methanotrichaceae archaeon]
MPVKKIGISVDEKTYAAAEEAVKDGEFRNISHVFDYAAKQMLRNRIEKLEKKREPL